MNGSILSPMEALLVGPALVLSFAATLFAGKFVLNGILTLMERGRRVGQV